jgi:hypothetical protein
LHPTGGNATGTEVDSRPLRGALGPPTNPVAPTSRWMAAARARESERADGLFDDPLAAALAGPEGFAWLEHMEPPKRAGGPGLYAVICTRFFDDFLLDACRRSPVRQVVLAAAGMDTRAFRLDWPSGTRLYEMDLLEVLDAKEGVIEAARARASCERRAVGVDPEAGNLAGGVPPCRIPTGGAIGLADRGSPLLPDRRSRARSPGEGADADGHRRLRRIRRDEQGSAVHSDGRSWLPSPGVARGRFGTNDPEALLARHGWEADATRPGEEGANFGRWPIPTVPRRGTSLPQGFLVRARRS